MARTVTMAAVALLAVGAAGCGRGGDHLAHAEQAVQTRVEDTMELLDATPQQTERAQALARGLLGEAKPIALGGKEAREVLVAEWKASAPDATRVHGLVDQQVDLARAFAHKAADAALEFHRLLTPAQREKVTKRLERFKR